MQGTQEYEPPDLVRLQPGGCVLLNSTMFSDLTLAERDLILRCVRAAASGELFPVAEAEYHVGVKEAELKSLLASPSRIGGGGYESPGVFAVDLCLSQTREVRRSRRLADIPETPDTIEDVRIKFIGGK